MPRPSTNQRTKGGHCQIRRAIIAHPDDERQQYNTQSRATSRRIPVRLVHLSSRNLLLAGRTSLYSRSSRRHTGFPDQPLFIRQQNPLPSGVVHGNVAGFSGSDDFLSWTISENLRDFGNYSGSPNRLLYWRSCNPARRGFRAWISRPSPDHVFIFNLFNRADRVGGATADVEKTIASMTRRL